jgi:pimeloyl-ACP methyl ester carboxylesterase
MAQATGQAPRERTLAEIKAEVMRRAEKLSPFESIKAADAERILGSIKSLDRDEWAAAWVAVGLEYEKAADALAAKGGRVAEIAEAYSLAFDYCRLGRYPAATTPGKKEAYRHSIRCFRKAAQYFEQPLQVVEIPFQGKTLTGYLQIPPGAKRPAIVMHWGGVDGWKEDRQRQNTMLNGLGLASLTIDMPGTGESPISYRDPNAEASYIAWLDHLAQRADVDGARVGVWGGSFGAYWAARLAHVVPDRIKGAVFHGGNVHVGFQRDWLVPAFTTGGATYLFGPSSLLEARGSAMGTKTMEDFLEVAPSFSLVALGLIDKPSAPILGINGKLDDQAPIADVYLLMEHGSPKCARVYPQGHHMGRTPGMPEDEITRTITTWLADRLGAK